MRETADRTWAALERARAEIALRESEERFREFGENSSDVLWIIDAEEFVAGADGTVWLTELDARAARTAGYTDVA